MRCFRPHLNVKATHAIQPVALVGSVIYLAWLLFGYLAGVGGVQRHHVESASYILAVIAGWTAFTRVTPSSAIAAPEDAWWWGRLPLFIAAAFVLYGSALGLGLFSDDFVLVERAAGGQWLDRTGFVRPLPTALWQAILAVGGGAVSLHAVNILLHGINAALLSRLGERIGLSRGEAVAAGIGFLVFPSSVEAVVWPAAIIDLLATTSALGFVLASERRPTRAGIAVGAAILLAGLLSKETAVVIPVLACLVWVRWPHVRSTPGLPTLATGVAITIAYTVVRAAIVQIPGGFLQPPTRYLLKEMVARPISTLTLPWSQSVLASSWWLGYLGAVTFIVLLAFYSWRPQKAIPPSLVVRCVIAVLLSVVPVYSMLSISPDLENGRYVYLPTAFWVIGLAAMAAGEHGGLGRVARTIAFAAIAVAAVVGVQWHLSPWKEAAAVRDEVLAAALAVEDTSPCAARIFSGAPDSVRGAYVFRNGLAQAVAASRRPAADRSRAGECRYVWTGSSFRLDSTSSP